MLKRKLILGVGTTAVSMLLGAGCTDVAGQTDLNADGLSDMEEDEKGSIAEPQFSKDWVGYQIGASPGVWKNIESMKIADPQEEYIHPIVDTSLKSADNPNPESLAFGDVEAGKVYEVQMDENDLADIAYVLTNSGINAPTLPDGILAEEDELTAKGWSGGVDNRIDRGIARYGTTAWPYRAIGQLKVNGASKTSNGYCSASFVGGAGDDDTRYILTAAHCLFSSSTGSYLNPDFWPRQDRCLDNQGNTVTGCDQGPYGEWDSSGWTVYTYFYNNCRGSSSLTWECLANDIALVKVTRQTGASFPGAMGFGSITYSDLSSNNKYHRGYPNCNGSGDPDPTSPTICLPRTLYGDNAFSINTGSMIQDGWPRVYSFSSDTSGGHSGGPAYVYYNSGQYVFGANSAESCAGSACTGTLVNYMRAIDSSWYNIMLNFMN